MGLIPTPEGVCPEKLRMYGVVSDGQLAQSFIPTDLVACDSGCPGYELRERKLLRIIPYSVEVCPVANRSDSIEQTADNPLQTS